MIVIQFQVTDANEEELNLVPKFCKWLQKNIINNYIYAYNEKRIKSRLDLVQNATWVKWKGNRRQKLEYKNIIELIVKSFVIKTYKDEVYKIETSDNVLIPGTVTSLDRLIRYLNSGDSTTPATDIITGLQHKLNYTQLNGYWRMYILQYLGDITDSHLITQIK